MMPAMQLDKSRFEFLTLKARSSASALGGRVRDRATVIQKKTSRPVQFEITA